GVWQCMTLKRSLCCGDLLVLWTARASSQVSHRSATRRRRSRSSAACCLALTPYSFPSPRLARIPFGDICERAPPCLVGVSSASPALTSPVECAGEPCRGRCRRDRRFLDRFSARRAEGEAPVEVSERVIPPIETAFQSPRDSLPFLQVPIGTAMSHPE